MGILNKIGCCIMYCKNKWLRIVVIGLRCVINNNLEIYRGKIINFIFLSVFKIFFVKFLLIRLWFRRVILFDVVKLIKW